MPLFRFWRKSKVHEIDIEGVRRRVHGMREAQAASPATLVDLFALVGENDLPRPRRSFTGEPPQPPRVMPEEIQATGQYQWEG